MKKKTGIITFHDTANYGAAFQAYATQVMLEKLCGSAEIIDYTNQTRSDRYSVKRRLGKLVKGKKYLSAFKNLLGSYFILLRKKRFNAFYKHRLKTSAQSYTSPDDLKKYHPDYEFYVSGSDQIWNNEHNGCDFNYLLDFAPDSARTISYASSFGLSKLPQNLLDRYSRSLKRISSLSVREPKGQELVKQATGRNAQLVLDPVFMLSPNEWRKLAIPKKSTGSPYVMVYTADSRYYSDFIEQTNYSLKDRKIVSCTSDLQLGDLLNRNIQVASFVGPEKFINLLDGADLILTSSFHGMVLSILFRKQFVVFLSGNSGRDERIINLLQLLGLSHRAYAPTMDTTAIDETIDYDSVFKKLKTLKEDSLCFISEALGVNKNQLSEKTGDWFNL